MGESTAPIRCHITAHEQVALGATLMRAEATGRDERAKKSRAFAPIEEGGFGLGWVREILEQPLETRVSLPDLMVEHDTIAADNKQAALVAIVNRVIAVTAADPFAGKRTKTAVLLTPARDVVGWVLDALNKLPPVRNQQGEAMPNPYDLALADIEERLSDAKRGTYRLPAELEAPAPALDIVPLAAESLGG